jgi:hypothetical protein
MTPLLRLMLVAVLFGAACSTTADPCAGEKGLCVALQIDPSSTVHELDSAIVRAIAPGLDHSYPATPAHGRVTLPVAIAVVFSRVPISAAVELDATGILNGKPVGRGVAHATLNASKHPTVHVALGPIALSPVDGGAPGDAGGPADAGAPGSSAPPDDSGPAPLDMTLTGLDVGFATPDLAGSTLTVDNATHEFDPLSVGNASPAFTFTISNNASSISGALQRTVVGDFGDFAIDNDNCGNLKLDAKRGCSVSVAFKPTSFGTKRSTITYDGGNAGLVVIQVAGVATDSETLTVTINGSGVGTVTGQALVCTNNNCIGTYAVGTTVPTVSLTASPTIWSDFAGWSGGGCNGLGLTCTVTMDASKQVTATFTQRPLTPSHVDPSFHYYKPTAADLTGVSAIDTSGMTLTINGTKQQLSTFTIDPHGWAVLSIGAWTVDRDVTITGGRALVVVAAGPVDIRGIIHGEAVGTTPGPGGGYTTSDDPKVFGPGNPVSPGINTGGGNFGGGAGSGNVEGSVTPPGSTYGPMLTDFNAGSSGAQGTSCVGCSACTWVNQGGGGGGGIQISSAVQIIVEKIPGMKSYGINVGGGGGDPGCQDPQNFGIANPGGGGSGGEVFLEAPAINVAGIIAANGGGGGLFDASVLLRDGTSNGQDGQLGDVPARGGFDSSNVHAGAGAFGSMPASTSTGGGGGGGVGRIWLRTRSTTATVIGTISPPPMTDTSL